MDDSRDGSGDTEPLPWRRRTRLAAPTTFSSPAVRRIAHERGLDLSTVPGTGAGGRITRDDARAAVAPMTVVEPPAPPGRHVLFDPVRRATAHRLVESLATAAHAHVVLPCDYTAVERVRREAGLTSLPFVARAVVAALAAFPHCNATVGDDHLVVHESVDLGIAVDLAFRGLVVPVVKRAEEYRLEPLARAISELAARARDRRLTSADVSGGTFTITNPGPFGTFASVPIINRPQVAILATDAVRKRVVVLDDGTSLAIRPVGMLSLGFDHRAIDGAYAAAFLGRVRDALEGRDWTSEL